MVIVSLTQTGFVFTSTFWLRLNTLKMEALLKTIENFLNVQNPKFLNMYLIKLTDIMMEHNQQCAFLFQILRLCVLIIQGDQSQMWESKKLMLLY